MVSVVESSWLTHEAFRIASLLAAGKSRAQPLDAVPVLLRSNSYMTTWTSEVPVITDLIPNKGHIDNCFGYLAGSDRPMQGKESTGTG